MAGHRINPLPAYFGRCVVELHFVAVVGSEEKGLSAELWVPGQA